MRRTTQALAQPRWASDVGVNAKIKELELDGNFHTSRYFRVDFGMGLLDSSYRNFTNASCTQLNPDGSVTATPAGNGKPASFCDVSGNDLIHAPKVTANIGGTATLPTNFGDFTATANLARPGRFYWDVTNRLDQR